MTGPLDGVLVVDLSRALAGPHAAMLPSDLGPGFVTNAEWVGNRDAVIGAVDAALASSPPAAPAAPATVDQHGAAVRAWLAGSGPADTTGEAG